MSHDEAEVVVAEHRWMQVVVEKDRAALRELLAPEFRMVSARTDRYADRDFYTGVLHQVELRAFRFDDVDVNLFGDTAVVRAQYVQDGSVAGRDWSGSFVFTDVWLRRDGRWQAVARHSSQPPRQQFLDPLPG